MPVCFVSCCSQCDDVSAVVVVVLVATYNKKRNDAVVVYRRIERCNIKKSKLYFALDSTL